MISAGCGNWWGGWCYNFRVDGLHAIVWGDYGDFLVHEFILKNFSRDGSYLLTLSIVWNPYVIDPCHFDHCIKDMSAFNCRACWEVSLLPETAG